MNPVATQTLLTNLVEECTHDPAIAKIYRLFFFTVSGMSEYMSDSRWVPETELMRRVLNMLLDGSGTDYTEIFTIAIREHRLAYIKIQNERDHIWDPSFQCFFQFQQESESIRVTLSTKPIFDMSCLIEEWGNHEIH